MENDKLVRHGAFAEWLKNRADDLASRAQKPVTGAPGCYTVDDGLSCAAAVMYDAYRIYQLQPAVDAVEVKRSEWEFTGMTDEWYGPVFRCKSCGGEMIGDPKFCCDCGARMDGRREDGDA